MKKVTLIACCKEKENQPLPAWLLYRSDLFSKSLAYANESGSDAVYILSAKYGLVDANRTIAPYDETLNDMNKAERTEWANKVLRQLLRDLDGLGGVEIQVLAGRNYRDHLCSIFDYAGVPYSVPMAGLGIGQQKAWLKAQLTNSKGA